MIIASRLDRGERLTVTKNDKESDATYFIYRMNEQYGLRIAAGLWQRQNMADFPK